MPRILPRIVVAIGALMFAACGGRTDDPQAPISDGGGNAEAGGNRPSPDVAATTGMGGTGTGGAGSGGTTGGGGSGGAGASGGRDASPDRAMDANGGGAAGSLDAHSDAVVDVTDGHDVPISDSAPDISVDTSADVSIDTQLDDIYDDERRVDSIDDIDASLGDEPDVPLDSTDVEDDGRVCPDGSPFVDPPCGCDLCGNGHIDFCPTEQSATLRELCDGTDFGAISCLDYGFASGRLECTTSCRPTTRYCEECVPSPALPLCLRPLQAFDVTTAAMASDGSYLGVAWLGQSNDIQFARLDANLSVVSLTAVTPLESYGGIALAPTPSGWIIAVTGRSSASPVAPIEVHTLSANGLHLQHRTVEDGQGLRLATREGGGPLLTYEHRAPGASVSVVRATLLDGDGNEAVAPFQIFSGETLQNRASVFVGDGFLVSQTIWTAQIVAHRIARIELDGQFQTIDTNISASALAWNGTVGRLLSAGFSTMNWQAVGKDGVPVGSPVAVPTVPSTWGGTLLAYGDDSILLRSMQTPSPEFRNRLELLRLDAAGATVLPATTVARGSQFGAYGLARLGNDVFAMWVREGTRDITVARLHPF